MEYEMVALPASALAADARMAAVINSVSETNCLARVIERLKAVIPVKPMAQSEDAKATAIMTSMMVIPEFLMACTR